MAQDGNTAGGNSYTIDNVTFPIGRTKLNSIFSAIRSTNIGSSAPDLVAGQFWIDNTTPSATVWTMYFYDGTDSIQFATIDTTNNTINFIDSTFDLINDTTPELGGNLSLNSNNITGTGNIDITGTATVTGLTTTGDINLGDNDKANFGASNDLQIYHDGSHSYVKDNGTGNLTLSGTNLYLTTTNGQIYLGAITDGAVSLYYDNAEKLATTSTGIDVTGNVTATAFYGDGSNLTGITTDATAIRDADNDTKIQTEETADEDKLRFDTGGSERVIMDSNGFQFTTNGGFVAHHSTIANDMSLTDKNMMLVGIVNISGTLTIGSGSTVVVL